MPAKSLSLNVDVPEGAQVLAALARTADCVIVTKPRFDANGFSTNPVIAVVEVDDVNNEICAMSQRPNVVDRPPDAPPT